MTTQVKMATVKWILFLVLFASIAHGKLGSGEWTKKLEEVLKEIEETGNSTSIPIPFPFKPTQWSNDKSLGVDARNARWMEEQFEDIKGIHLFLLSLLYYN